MTTSAPAEFSYSLAPENRTPGERVARAGGWWALLLTLILADIVAEAVLATAWSEGLQVVRVAVIGGAMLGVALALTRWDGTFAVLYSLLASVFCITVFQNRILLPDFNTHDAVLEIVQRNAGWFLTLVRGGAGSDNLVFVTQLSYLGWWLGYFAAWSIFRHRQVLTAIIPLSVALIVNLYYSPVNLSGYLLVFLAAVLLLAMRVELACNETRWQISRIRYAPDIYIDFLKSGAIFAVIAVTLAWAIPGVASRGTMERVLRPFDRSWKTIEDTWSRMYQSLNYPRAAPVVSGFGKSLSLGGPVSLSDRPVFEGQFPQRTYWRAAAYDTYDGAGWANTDEETTIIEHDRWLGEPLFDMTTEMTATIRSLEQGGDVIVAPPQPVRVSVPVEADAERISEDGVLSSISLMRSRLGLGLGAIYKVASAVTEAPPELLRTDKTDYPSWILARYLQVPGTLPERVTALAREITAPYDNPFDKAAAVESFLRKYPYNQSIAAPPGGADGVDYFLFEVRQGYCDYYASAMAIMLRAVGIPTRIVVGYAPGELLRPANDKSVAIDTYRVLERDAHAWPEVFFPSYGWIQFEPTAAQPRLARPILVESAGTSTPPPTPLAEENLEDLRPPPGLETGNLGSARPVGLLPWLEAHWVAPAIILMLSATVLGARQTIKRRRLALLKDPDLLARLFGWLGKWAARLRVPWPVSRTPLENARELGHRLPEVAGSAYRLAGLFVAQRYGRQDPEVAALASTVDEWRSLQLVFWKRWLREAIPLGRRGKH